MYNLSLNHCNLHNNDIALVVTKVQEIKDRERNHHVEELEHVSLVQLPHPLSFLLNETDSNRQPADQQKYQS